MIMDGCPPLKKENSMLANILQSQLDNQIELENINTNLKSIIQHLYVTPSNDESDKKDAMVSNGILDDMSCSVERENITIASINKNIEILMKLIY